MNKDSKQKKHSIKKAKKIATEDTFYGHSASYIDHKKTKKYHFVVLSVFVVGFAVAGALFVFGSFAAVRNYAQIEAESASVSGNVAVKSDSTAAGGSYLQFNTPTTPSFQPAYPGQPRPGKAYWGSSYAAGSDPTARFETPTKDVLGVRRVFFQASQVDNAVTKAKDDIAKGRIPVYSFKLPADWGVMANGSQDAWIDNTLKKFDALNGPVWLTFHHEPEGGDGNGPDQYGTQSAAAANHLAMDKHIRERMTALKTDNIALALTLMGCTYSGSCSGRNPADWYAPGVYDIIAADTYWGKGDTVSSSTPLLSTKTGNSVLKFAAERGKDAALFEWGFGDEQGPKTPALMQGMFNDMIKTPPQGQSRLVAAMYFDTTLNGGHPLVGDTLEMFYTIMKNANSTNWPNEVAGAQL